MKQETVPDGATATRQVGSNLDGMRLAGALCSTLAAVMLLVVSLGSGRWFVEGEHSIGLRAVAVCADEPEERPRWHDREQRCDGVELSSPSRGGAWWTFWFGVFVVGLLMVIGRSVVVSGSTRFAFVGCLASFVLLASGLSVSSAAQVGFAFMTFLTGCLSALLACIFSWPQLGSPTGPEVGDRRVRTDDGRWLTYGPDGALIRAEVWKDGALETIAYDHHGRPLPSVDSAPPTPLAPPSPDAERNEDDA